MFYVKPLRLLVHLGLILVVFAIVLQSAEAFRPKLKPKSNSKGKFIDHHYGKFGKHTMQTKNDKHILSKRKKPKTASSNNSPLLMKPASIGNTNLKPVSLKSPTNQKSLSLKPISKVPAKPKTKPEKVDQKAADRQKDIDIGIKIYNCPKEAIQMNCLSCKTKVYRKCPVVGASNVTGVHIINEYPSSIGRCYVGKRQNYGIVDGTGIWVDKGCRAKFIICYNREINEPKTVNCACIPGSSTKRCDVPGLTGSKIVIKVVMLFKYQGKCKEDKNWGYDDRRIWVSDGCGATFKVFWS